MSAVLPRPDRPTEGPSSRALTGDRSRTCSLITPLPACRLPVMMGVLKEKRRPGRRPTIEHWPLLDSANRRPGLLAWKRGARSLRNGYRHGATDCSRHRTAQRSSVIGTRRSAFPLAVHRQYSPILSARAWIWITPVSKSRSSQRRFQISPILGPVNAARKNAVHRNIPAASGHFSPAHH